MATAGIYTTKCPYYHKGKLMLNEEKSETLLFNTAVHICGQARSHTNQGWAITPFMFNEEEY